MDAFRIIISACVYLILPIMFFVLRNLTKPKKNILLGVTLPYEASSEKDVKDICARFKFNLNLMFIIMTLLCAVGLFIPGQSVMFTYEMLWLVFALVVPFLIYAKAYSRLKNLKAARGWGAANPPAEFKTQSDIAVKRIKGVWFILPIIVSLMPCLGAAFINNGEALVMIITGASFALVTALMYVIYAVTVNRPREAFNGIAGPEEALTQVRRNNRGRCFLFIAWSTAIYSAAFMFLINSGAIFLAVTAVYTILLLYICIKAEFYGHRFR